MESEHSGGVCEEKSLSDPSELKEQVIEDVTNRFCKLIEVKSSCEDSETVSEVVLNSNFSRENFVSVENDKFIEVNKVLINDKLAAADDTDIIVTNDCNESNCNIIKDAPINETDVGMDKMDCESEDNASLFNYCVYNFKEFIEIAKSTKPFDLEKFLVGCKWSPDGTCLLTNCADFTIRLFDLPIQLYNKHIWNRNEVLPELLPSLQVIEGGQIYDYEWYPFMSSLSPDTCCFLTTSSRSPVHLWDAYTGKIRATYRGYNRADETDNAMCVKFSLNGEKIYCGYKNEIKIFDIAIPGRDCISIDTKHVAGQTGLISCIAENPAVRNMFAAGSYKRSIGLYLESGDNICLLKGQRCGVTHILWSHDGSCLYSGGRKDNEIICWDMRNPGEVLYTMERYVDTNQRIYFDLTPDGKYLISGNTNGEIIGWDLNQTTEISEKQKHIFKFRAHLDCTNGISVHRQIPLLATSSGQHHFPDLTSDDEDNNFFDMKKMISRIENSIKLWWIGQLEDHDHS